MNPGSNHAAVFFTQGGCLFSYGENKPKFSGVLPTVHAEDDAIDKLPVLKKSRRRLKRLNLLVIRANAGGSVGNSKPCFACVNALRYKLPKKGYVLDTVYYTDRGGTITAKKFSRLSEDQHIPKFYASGGIHHQS